MIDFIKKIENLLTENNGVILRIVFILLILIKLILVMGNKTYLIPESRFDDKLMYDRAVSISNGQWLGSYNNATLTKGVFFSLWLSFLNLLSLPYLLGNQTLYSVSCLVFIWSIKPTIKNKIWELLCFTVLLFNPASLGPLELLRVYRDGIFPSLIMLVFAGTIGLFLYRDDIKKMFLSSIICGIGLSTAWLTREDAFWILPFIIIAIIICTLFLVFAKDYSNKRIKIFLSFFPFFLLFLANFFVSSINLIKYGRFIPNDYTSKDFKAAYGALTRVSHEVFEFYNPVPEEVRYKIYEVSPAFNELKPFLEDGILENWKDLGKIHLGLPKHDFYFWFMWALRDAVAECGYYKNSKTAKEFYESLANEINYACDAGMLPSKASKRVSLSTPFTKNYILPTAKNVMEATKYIIKYEGIESFKTPIIVDENQQQMIRDMEIYTNQLSLNTVNYTELMGWVFDESENITVRLIDGLKNEIPATITIGDSVGLYDYFIKNFNEVYENALKGQLFVKYVDEPNADHYLCFIKENGETVELLINNELTNTGDSRGEHSTIRYYIDKVDYHRNSVFTRVNLLKFELVDFIIRIYQLFNPLITFISLLSMLFLTVLVLKSLNKKNTVYPYNEVIILWGLLLAFFSRKIMIGYVTASAFPAINYMYLSSSYPIVIIFNCISIYCLLRYAKSFMLKQKNHKSSNSMIGIE